MKEWSVRSAGLVHLCVVVCCLCVIAVRDPCIIAWKSMHMDCICTCVDPLLPAMSGNCGGVVHQYNLHPYSIHTTTLPRTELSIQSPTSPWMPSCSSWTG